MTDADHHRRRLKPDMTKVRLSTWCKLANMQPTDWIIAASSVSSMIIAAFACAAAWRLHRLERKRQADAELAATRAQANLISAWEEGKRISIEEVPEGQLSDEEIAVYDEEQGVYVSQAVQILVNRSDQPVYDVITKARGATPFPYHREILAPGETRTWGYRYATVRMYDLGRLAKAESLIDMSFRDAAGNRWVRKAEGDLIEVSSQKEHDAAMQMTD